MIKKIIIVVGIGVINLLHGMDQELLKERLQRRYKTSCEKKDVQGIRSAYNDFIRLGIADKEELDNLIREFEPSSNKSASQAGPCIDDDRSRYTRSIMYEQNCAYREALRADQERERIKQEADQERERIEREKKEKEEQERASYKKWLNQEFVFMKPLDEAIVKLAKVNDPQADYDNVAPKAFHLLSLFGRQGAKIANVLKEENDCEDKSKDDQKISAYNRIIKLINGYEQKLDELRAERIVNLFWGHDDDTGVQPNNLVHTDSDNSGQMAEREINNNRQPQRSKSFWGQWIGTAARWVALGSFVVVAGFTVVKLLKR